MAGIPFPWWAYAFRIWAAMLVALYAGFWLEFPNASSAAITVTILSQPTRGQAFGKAVYRVLGTVVGFVASIAITALFPQARDLYVLAYSLWVAACVFTGTLFEGTRAYAFVLSGYTVALVVVSQTDKPQAVFDGAVGRVAAVMLGIAAIALINDFLAAPDIYPKARDGLRKAFRELDGSLGDSECGTPGDERDAIAERIVESRPNLLALPTETPAGGRRAAAARSAAVAMIEALAAARMSTRAADRRSALGDRPDSREADRIMTRRFEDDATDALRLASTELDSMDAGTSPARIVGLPHHRNVEQALRKAARVFFTVAVSAIVLIQSGWPETTQALVQIIVLACLGMTQPDDRAYVRDCLISMPLATVISGVTKFVFLNGSDGFPMLAVGMAPGVFLCCLLFCYPKTSGVGFLALIYVATMVSPTNVQTYDPREFVITAFLYNLSVVFLAVMLSVFIPTNDRDLRRWVSDRVLRDLRAALSGRSPGQPAEIAYRNADRVSRLRKLDAGPAGRRWRRAALLGDVTLAIARADAAIAELSRTGTCPDATRAREAIRHFCPHRLETAAADIAGGVDAGRPWGAAAVRAVADLRFLALMAAAPPPALRRAIGRQAA